MKQSRDRLLFGLMCSLCAMSYVMSIAYIHTNITNQNGRPFQLSEKYIILKLNGDNRVHFDDAVDLEMDNSIILISWDLGSDFIGIYDPKMTKSFQNVVKSYGLTRYFSIDDYRNHNSVGIMVLGLTPYSIEACQGNTDTLVQEVLYCTDTQSDFEIDGILRAVVNVSSLPYLGDTVYIDGVGSQEIETVANRLIALGYEKYQLKALSIFEVLFTKKGTIIDSILKIGIVLYGFLGIATYWWFYHQRRSIRIHLLHGGRLNKMVTHFNKPYVLPITLSILPMIGLMIYLKPNGLWLVPLSSSIAIIIMHILLVSILNTISFYLNYKHSLRQERVKHDCKYLLRV